jgi:hypothetical protein
MWHNMEREDVRNAKQCTNRIFVAFHRIFSSLLRIPDVIFISVVRNEGVQFEIGFPIFRYLSVKINFRITNIFILNFLDHHPSIINPNNHNRLQNNM